jgi:hypothetical protein
VARERKGVEPEKELETKHYSPESAWSDVGCRLVQ